MTEPKPQHPPELTLVTGGDGAPVQAFFDAVAPIFTGNLRATSGPALHETRLLGVNLGPLVMSRASMTGISKTGISQTGINTTGATFSFDRDARMIARTGMDLIFVQIITAGSDLRLVGGAEVRSRPGDIFVADLTRPMRTQTQSCANLSFVLPRQAFGLSEAELDSFHDRILPAGSMAARLVASHVGMIWEERQSFSAAEALSLVQGTAGLLAGLLRGQEGSSDPVVSRHLEICRFIDLHLQEPDLGPEMLCLRFGLSRAALYRMFTGSEGVAGHIRERRLRRAFHMLTRPGRVAMAQVGFACGFQSASSFSRAFKARFGIAPGEAHLAAIEGLAAKEGTLATWLQMAQLATPG